MFRLRLSRTAPFISGPLTTHFRQPEIIEICDALCGYGLEIETKPVVGPLRCSTFGPEWP